MTKFIAVAFASLTLFSAAGLVKQHEYSIMLSHREFMKLSPSAKQQYMADVQQMFVEIARTAEFETAGFLEGFQAPAKWSFLTMLLRNANASDCGKLKFKKGSSGLRGWLAGKSTANLCVINVTGTEWCWSEALGDQGRQNLEQLTSACPSQYQAFLNTLNEKDRREIEAQRPLDSVQAPAQAEAPAALSNLRCIYGGVPIEKEAGEGAGACKPRSKMTINGKEYSCEAGASQEQSQGRRGKGGGTVLCNPALFGTDPGDKAICVWRSTKATEQCAAKSNDDARKRAIELAQKDPKEYLRLRQAADQLCPGVDGKHTAYVTDTLKLPRKSQDDLSATCEKYKAAFTALNATRDGMGGTAGDR